MESATRVGEQAPVMLITGPPGSGKTRILTDFERKHPSCSTKDGTRPVVWLTLPARCTTRGVLEVCLQALGICVKARWTEVSLTGLLKHHVHYQRVKVLLIDDAHVMLRAGTRAMTYQAADAIKTIVNFGICAVVLAALPALRALVTDNGQLTRRVTPMHELCQLTKTGHEREVFEVAMQCFAEGMPLGFDFLNDPVDVLRLQQLADGLPPMGFKLLREAYDLARRTQDGVVTSGHLKAVAKRRSGVKPRDWVNPFEVAEQDLIAMPYSSQSLDEGLVLNSRRGRRPPRRLHEAMG